MPISQRGMNDIGADLGSPVSVDYFDKAPFRFNGTIATTSIKYLK
jgi:arylsulfatase